MEDDSLKWDAVKLSNVPGGDVALPQNGRELLVVMYYQVSQLQASIEELKRTQLEELKRNQIELQKTISNTFPQLQNVTTEINGVKESINDLEEDVNCLQKKIDDVVAEQSILQENQARYDTYFKVMSGIAVIVPTILATIIELVK